MGLSAPLGLAFRKNSTREESKEIDADGVDKQMTKIQARITNGQTNNIDLKFVTRTRKRLIAVSSAFFSLSVIFLILTIIGNTSKKSGICSTYFLKLDLANIIPASTPADLHFVNSLARSLGLHDFYQVGLWNYCEGYNNEGVTFCSKPKTRYWFNPVEILLSQLLAGASIALPADINNILDIIKLASRVMFCFFLAGVCMNWISIFVAPITLYSRWWSLPFSLWAFFAAFFTTVATIIVTAMSLIFVNVSTSQPGLNIGADIGLAFFAFMWIASSFSILGLFIHLCLLCCFTSRRDITTGRKSVKESYHVDSVSTPNRRPMVIRKWFEKIATVGHK